MARPKKNAVRTPKNVDEQYMGTEPRILKITSSCSMINSLNWYNYFQDNDAALRYVLKAFPEKEDEINMIPKSELRTLGWLCRMKSNGTDLGAFANKPNELLEGLVKRYVRKQKDEAVVVAGSNPNSRLKSKNSRYIAELESEIDAHWRTKNYKFDAYQWMVANQIGNLGAKAVADYYNQWENKDSFINSIIEAANRISSNSKVVRKARRRKPVSASKATAKLQYKKSDITLKLESANPADIIGASEVWVYNVEKRMMTVYRGETLSVKGTTINGFDPEQSFSKKLRKPEQDITKFIGSKAALKKAFGGLTTKAANVMVGRTNEDTIILKVFK